MASVPNEELNKALDLWLYIQATQPAWAADYIKRHAGRNPFDPWPPEKDRVDEFLRVVNESLFHNETPEGLAKTIDAKKREELVDEFNREFDKVKSARTAAEVAAKARMQDVIRNTLENKDVAPNQKELLFKVLEAKSAREPSRAVAELVPDAIATGEAAQVFINPETAAAARGFKSSRFRDLKGLSGFQKAVTAPALDALTTVFPGLKQGVMNKNLAFALEDLLKKTDNLTKIFGQGVVNERWYQDVIKNAGQIIAQGKPPGSAKTIIDDVASSLFRGPTSQTMIAYVELVQINYVKGLPPPNINQFMAANMGVGANAFRLGASLLVQKGEQKAFSAILAKAGLAAIPGPGWVGTLIAGATSFVGKAINWFKNLILPKTGEVPGDKWILGIGCGSILFIFLLLPFMNQLNIDSSLYRNLSIGGAPGTGGPVVDCTQTPDDPQCKFTACTGNCQWPASGIITQGPFTAGYCGDPNQTSHDVGNAANGIDIANSGGGPVYTPRAGTVVEAYTSCANNSGHVGDHCGGSPAYAGYGNHVILKTDDGYTLIFGHMESAMNVRAGDHVAAGTQLGWMDQTGNSTGTHLHFGVLSGGSVLDFVPKDDTAHAPNLLTGCVDGESTCKKTCPYEPVSAGQ